MTRVLVKHVDCCVMTAVFLHPSCGIVPEFITHTHTCLSVETKNFKDNSWGGHCGALQVLAQGLCGLQQACLKVRTWRQWDFNVKA